MLGFDPRSFIIISAVLGLLCAFVFFALRRSFPRDIQGLTHWAWACLIMVPAAFLFMLRGSLPVFWSSFVANMLVVAGIMLMYFSVARFADRPASPRRLAAVLMLLAALLAWPTFVVDDYRLRVIVVSTMNTWLFAASAWTILQMKSKHFAERLTMAAFLFAASISGVRCGAAVFQLGVIDPVRDISTVQHVYLATFAVSIITLSLGFLLMVNRRLHDRLQYAAMHDHLTGVFRREAVLEAVGREMTRTLRYGQPLALLMIDLDNFKVINDDFGHQTGDKVIVDFSRKAQQALRTHDVMGRYGGEEFIVLLPNTSWDGAYIVADRIRTLSGQRHLESLPPYTVSIGIATLQGRQEDIDALVRKADEALFAAKRGGKNRIEVRL